MKDVLHANPVRSYGFHALSIGQKNGVGLLIVTRRPFEKSRVLALPPSSLINPYLYLLSHCLLLSHNKTPCPLRHSVLLSSYAHWWTPISRIFIRSFQYLMNQALEPRLRNERIYTTAHSCLYWPP